MAIVLVVLAFFLAAAGVSAVGSGINAMFLRNKVTRGELLVLAGVFLFIVAFTIYVNR